MSSIIDICYGSEYTFKIYYFKLNSVPEILKNDIKTSFNSNDNNSSNITVTDYDDNNNNNRCYHTMINRGVFRIRSNPSRMELFSENT